MGEEGPKVSDAVMIAILREAVESAADRVIAQRERETAKPRKQARQVRLPMTAGHVYAIILCVTLLAIIVAGSLSKGG